ncbi:MULTISPECIES: TIGR03086 family metal-binding protein [unclassified Streptomyces]|uniref:TIGR03086 family metal-binding protein n=1 Tax=unclassified Streptomyces TaxID=2593676 RepID=UPI002DDC4F2F|nr:TIGR03086 family metal-binding protein [Streptomyces sp. NBC_01445]WSE07986.1 TIGR03086 family metal-binding protein [Streptomyces sp. NBC_01445]
MPDATDQTAQQMVDFGPQTRLVARLADGVGEDQLNLATPCPEYAVRNLLGHILGLTVAFGDAARKNLSPTTDTSPTTFLPDITDGWRDALAKALDELAVAWRDPEAWQGMTRAGGVDLPAEVAGLVALDELVVHGWDLARTTGQEYDPEEAALGAAHAFLAQSTGPDRPPIFGPVVPVPDEAPLLDRVVGLSGRDPQWRPAP